MGVVVCEAGNQGFDVFEEEWLADVEGPACERHCVFGVVCGSVKRLCLRGRGYSMAGL